MILLILAWILYYVLHSLLATTWAKNKAAAHWSGAPRYYRLAYNQVSVWLFLLVLRYQLSLPATRVAPDSPVFTFGGCVLMGVGILLAVLAMRGYSLSEFAGWAYVRSGAAAANTSLNTGGLNSVVRHPFYAGILLGLGGFFMLNPTLPWLVFVVCAMLYILIGSHLEERKLLQRFGEAYSHYRQRVPMLLPRFNQRSKS